MRQRRCLDLTGFFDNKGKSRKVQGRTRRRETTVVKTGGRRSYTNESRGEEGNGRANRRSGDALPPGESLLLSYEERRLVPCAAEALRSRF